MPEKIPQFDFSKIEDQEKFNTSEQEVKNEVISQARKEAAYMKDHLKEWPNYAGVEKRIESKIDLAVSHLKNCSEDEERIYVQEYLDDLIYIRTKFPVSFEHFPATEIEDAVFEGLKVFMSQYDIGRAEKIIKNFDISQSKLESPGFEDDLMWFLIDSLNNDDVHDLVIFRSIFPSFVKKAIPDEEIEHAIIKGLEKYLLGGQVDMFIDIKNKSNLSELILHSSKILEILRCNYPQAITINDLENIYNMNSIGKDLCESIFELNNFSYTTQIKPLINSQGSGASLYFKAIKDIKDFQNLSDGDVDYVTYIGKRYGVQARNILENILTKINSISGERDVVEGYINEIGVMNFDIYSQYKIAKESGNQEEVENLKERIDGLRDKIYQGEMKEDDFRDDLYKAVSYNAFPPAMGLTQDNYNQLNQSRPDRRADVPESLNELQYQKFKVPTGRYVLSGDEDLNLEEWSALSGAVKKVNQELSEKGKIEIIGEEVGAKLIDIYRGKKQNTDEGRDYLFEIMYRYHLSKNGGKLDDGYEMTVAGLMKYKEFIGDRIKNDLVKDCLADWSAKHSDEYEELKKETMNRLKQGQNENFAKVRNMNEAIRKQKDEAKRNKAIVNLDDFLSDFGLSYVGIKDMDQKDLQKELNAITVEYDGEITKENYRSEQYYNSEGFISAYDELMSKNDQDKIVVRKISSDLVAGTNKKMRKEMDKFEFSDGGGAEERELEFVVSKKKEHGVAGYNMGVCVTPDEKLWNDPEFMNCIIFDPEIKQAMGGMHLLVRENCLCLPGINPSLDVLGQVKNEELFKRMIEYAKKVKEKMGLEKVLIPTALEIFSNRTQIHEIVRNNNFKKYSLKQEVDFSYNPYGYKFQECFEI